jgi:hypothetical protein
VQVSHKVALAATGVGVWWLYSRREAAYDISFPEGFDPSEYEWDEEEYGSLRSDSWERQAKRKRAEYGKWAKKYKACVRKRGKDDWRCKRYRKKMKYALRGAKELEKRISAHSKKWADWREKREKKKDKDKSKDRFSLFDKDKSKDKSKDKKDKSRGSSVLEDLAPPADWREQGYLQGEGEGGSYYPDDEEDVDAGLGPFMILGGVAILGVAGVLVYALVTSKPKATEEIEEISTSTGPALVPEAF